MSGKSERIPARLAMVGWGLAALVGVALGTIARVLIP